ncbi:SusC/RagA family TonB-linked outer membrane protein [Bacteroides neonati]|uniref:SusC/RagA family TonB-linked outer membrane protein n=1 Tax=Bacteroides neonati TaxID=1347393 RepID=UPI0005A9D7E7|nr:SusC/RagA family TonB-linked outer membrane protein [Bacteroides neonati]
MKRKLMLLLTCLFVGIGLVTAQTQKVTGVVISEEDGQPVVGASVLVKGTTVGTITDIDGKFTLSNVPSSARTLQVSFIGMKSQDVGIKSILKIVLDPDSELLDEVVVTGMTKVDKRLFTGAAASLNADNVKLDGIAEISRGLEGRAAGVSVQNVSGTFGTAPKIRVRGATSIYGSSKPLWVVDGVVMEDVIEVSADQLSSGDATTLISSAIAGLNSDDIESFQILKDGSATSIYGARAMAGVIVVTTKKGKSGQSRISYTGEFTYRLKPRYSEFNIMNSQDQMGVYQEMQQKGFLTLADVGTASESGVYGKMYDLIAKGKLLNTEAARNEYLREAEFRNTNWFDELFQSNLMQTHSVSVTSGNEKANYYASLSALIDPGWSKQSKVNRYTANLNATYNILDNLSINLISGASYRKQNAPGTLSSNIDAVNGEVKRDFDINPYSYALNTSRALDPSVFYNRNYAEFNILHELQNNTMDINLTDLKFQGEMKWKPIKGLEASILGAVKYQSTSQEHHISDFSNQAMAYRAMPTTTIRDKNPFLYTDPDNIYSVPITVLPQGGIYERSDYSMLSYDFRGALSYNTVIDDKHIINLYGGTEVNSADRHKTWFRGWGMQYAMGEIPFYAYQVFKKGAEEGSDYYNMTNMHSRNIAFFGNTTYSYQGRYIVNGTIRYEGSNKLGRTTSSRWLPTWNVSAAWNAHEEAFFKSITPAVSHLTLKASYSLTADRGPANVTNSRVVIGSYNPWRPTSGVSESGLNIVNLENGALTYEKKHELNIGIDLGFIDNRIGVAADWYKRNNYDLIGIVNTQGLGGEIQKYGNVASMKSSGFELTLSTKNIQTKDFSWSTDFIYSHNKNEVTELETTSRVIDLVSGTGFAKQGYPVRSIFSIPFEGLNNEGLPTFTNQKGEKTVSGVYFQERKNHDFLVYSGSADPTDMGSLGNIFSYKNFRLNVFITYSWGNVIRLDPVFKSSYSDLTSMPKEYRNRWVVPGDENITTIPVIASVRQRKNDSNLGVAYNSYNYSTERIADGDFIRMKEVSLVYDFPKGTISKWKLSNLSLKLQATNLFLIYADKKLNGQDPEFFNTGGVAAPVPKQFTLTLRLGL